MYSNSGYLVRKEMIRARNITDTLSAKERNIHSYLPQRLRLRKQSCKNNFKVIDTFNNDGDEVKYRYPRVLLTTNTDALACVMFIIKCTYVYMFVAWPTLFIFYAVFML